MYNLMIVDDDQLVRKRILSAIQFEKLGLQLCAEAEDGIQALDLFEQYHPQIVIMDINIPFLNGIDVSKKILEENEDVNIVIVTGYGTVSFAKEAIRSGMVDFLLKPIDFTELEAALSRIVRSIREKTQQAAQPVFPVADPGGRRPAAGERLPAVSDGFRDHRDDPVDLRGDRMSGLRRARR